MAGRRSFQLGHPGHLARDGIEELDGGAGLGFGVEVVEARLPHVQPELAGAGRVLTLALALTVTLAPAAEAQSGLKSNRRWLFTLIGAVVAGVPSYAFAGDATVKGNCTSRTCVGVAAGLIGAGIGFLIGSELESRYKQRMAAGPSLTYSFQNVVSGSYWVAADSKTLAPVTGLNVGFAQGDVWAEQTYGSIGALCANGSGGTTTRASAGPCYGGQNATVSDEALGLENHEHVTRVVVAASDVGGVDFGFSFLAVVNTRDGDDDVAADRTVQGSLRQFLQNANALGGGQGSVFRIPLSDPGYDPSGNNEFSIRPLTALPG